MTSEPSAETMTAYEVGVMRGYTGDRRRVIRSAHVWLSRNGIQAVGRQVGRGGGNLYPADTVRAADQNAPGKGAPGRPRAKRGTKESEESE